MSPRLCRCHGVPMRKETRQWRCVVHARITWRRAAAIYRATPHGQAQNQRNNARRIYVGRKTMGHAQTPEQARRINLVMQQRLAEFLTRQRKEQDAFKSRLAGGTESQGGVVGEVSAEAAAGGD